MSRAKEVRKKLHALYEYGVVADNDPMSDTACNLQFQISMNPVRNVQNIEAGTPGERYLDFKELRYLLTLLNAEKNISLSLSQCAIFVAHLKRLEECYTSQKMNGI